MCRILIAVTLIVSFALLGGCSTNPATGRSQLILFSAQQVNAMGEEAKPELVAEYGGEVPDVPLRNYVAGVGQRLLQHVEPEYADLHWEFTVLDSDVINAFALPGGKVFISRGLLERFSNEAQLAGVLGHEIGHVTARHVDERLSHAMTVQGIAIGASAAAGQSESGWAQAIPLLVGVGGQGYLLKFGRSQEAESDTLGMRYMVRAGYDPEGMREVLQVLQEVSSGPKQPEFLSTHPYPETRIRTVDALLAGEYAHTRDNSAYQKYEWRFQQEAAPYLQRAADGDAIRPSLAAAGWCLHCARSAAEDNLSAAGDSH